jgi:hypothetical protein
MLPLRLHPQRLLPLRLHPQRLHPQRLDHLRLHRLRLDHLRLHRQRLDQWLHHPLPHQWLPARMQGTRHLATSPPTRASAPIQRE